MDIPGDIKEHERFMREAINMAELALKSDETPVGCVFVHEGEIIGRGMNDTNRSLNVGGNGTRHAEFMALSQILATNPPSILRETDLYVTVEPCIMCASLLRQFKIRSCYFGASNERFGGTGGVLNIHSDIIPGENGSEDVGQEEGGYKGYPAYGGVFREEAILLLRRFYVQDNEKVPVEKARKKERELKVEIEPWEIHGGLARKDGSSLDGR